MIRISGLTFAYPGQEPVFAGLEWRVAPGESWAVLGPSGCGKTTLLYLLAGLAKPSDGEIFIAGERQSGPRPRTGLILQDHGLLPWATARRNVTLGLRIRRFYGPDGKHAPADEGDPVIAARADHWIERLGLAQHAEKYPGQLSGGQRQRVAIARTLALHPDLLLMDEPFSSLDAPTRESLQDLTFDLRADQALTTVIVTHAIEEAAMMGEQIMLLHEPPNRRPTIVANSGAGAPGYRHSPAYFEIVRQLQELLRGQVTGPE